MFSNAQEAMEKGGTLKVGAENVVVGAGNGLALKRGNYVRLFVQDEGPGIEEARPQEDFRPLFYEETDGLPEGHGSGPEHLLRRRQGPRRSDHGRFEARKGDALPHILACRRDDGGHPGDPGRNERTGDRGKGQAPVHG